MKTSLRRTRPRADAESAAEMLFASPIEDQILFSCHLLGKPTAEQLHRLHRETVRTIQEMRGILRRLSSGGDRMLNVINPLDIAQPFRKLPRVYLDTTRSRRHLEKTRQVPFKRPPELPSRDWRFLRHDVELVDELVAFELTARTQNVSFGIESHYDINGDRIYPPITITDGELTHTLVPKPDKTLYFNGWQLILEKDMGEETIELGNIIRDATIARKHLVYDQLERSGALDDLGWGKRLYLFTIDGKKGTQRSSRKRLKRCLETMPELQIKERTFFVDRQSFVEAGDNLWDLAWIRGDGARMRLPCCR